MALGMFWRPQGDAWFDWVVEILMLFEIMAANQRCVLAEPMVRAIVAETAHVQQPISDDDSSGVD